MLWELEPRVLDKCAMQTQKQKQKQKQQQQQQRQQQQRLSSKIVAVQMMQAVQMM